MEKQKNMVVNFIFSVLKALMGVVFPLITFQYASNRLGPTMIGKIDYAYANTSYFTLIAAFGISSYAIREGSKYRNDKDKINQFAGEILAINLCTVGLAYLLCFLALFIPKLLPYRGLMLLFSTTIVLTAAGMEWLYNIYEDYQYITIRAFFFQLIALAILFFFVKDEQDYIIYAVTIITSSVGSNIMNIVRARKYIKFRIIFNENFWKHVKPMSYLFVMNAATSIYLVMDRSMLGYITGNDTEVGLYTTAIKICTVITALIASVRTVTTPRSAFFIKTDPEQSSRINYMSLKIICMLCIPSAVGMYFIGQRVLGLFLEDAYQASTQVLQILMLDVAIAAVNGCLVNQFFIINKKDKEAATAVILGAVVNLIANSIMIPIIGKTGAAISTVLSEFVIFGFSVIAGRDVVKLKKFLPQMLQSLVSCIPMVLCFFGLVYLRASDVVVVFGTIVLGAITYFMSLFLMGNELVKQGVSLVVDKLKKK